MRRSQILGFLLVLSALNLAAMVPGGFVETRHFPDYSVTTLAAFNVFLTLLGLVSLAMGIRFMRRTEALWAPILLSLGFLAVYVADLAKIFPVATEPMSMVLKALEVFGSLLAGVTIVLGLPLLARPHESHKRRLFLPVWALWALGLLAVMIVIFATLSAM
ncbi:hypothetical protein [Thioclava sp. GXIMD4216]|uniref:DUF8051 domain-containing protein n=1 Tax=Thioclava litoralis TaxID=3076557 RepID=A0ABZ1DYZ5_9RHOB|nr:hypothetical protein RPE78_11080 [Thioclava sp. FTW29]